MNLDEYFIDVEGIAVATVPSLQTTGINRTEFDAPETYPFASNNDASPGKQVFNISMAQVESIVQPDGVRSDVGWKSEGATIGARTRI